MKLTRDDLIEEVLKSFLSELEKEDLKIACNIMFDSISEALAAKERVELRGFASFSTRQRLVPLDPRKNKGENNKRSSCNSIYFKMSKNLNEKLNG